MEVSADWCATIEHWRSSSIREQNKDKFIIFNSDSGSI